MLLVVVMKDKNKKFLCGVRTTLIKIETRKTRCESRSRNVHIVTNNDFNPTMMRNVKLLAKEVLLVEEEGGGTTTTFHVGFLPLQIDDW